MLSLTLQKYAAKVRSELNQTQADQQRQAAKAADRETEAWHERLTPLETRLAKILFEIPDEIKGNGLSLHTLQTFLKGRWRGCAHPGELGAALRRLRWSRTRQWRGDAIGFRALWYPPTTSIRKEQ